MAVISNSGYIAADVELPVRQVAGAPVNGAAGTYFGHAKPGTLLVDTTNAILYINTNTLASPTWSAVGNVAPAELTNLLAAIPTAAVATVASADAGAAPGAVTTANATTPASVGYVQGEQTALADLAISNKTQLNLLITAYAGARTEVNEVKAQLNALLVQLRTAGIVTP